MFFRRIFLFFTLNIITVFFISFLLHIFQVDTYFRSSGIDLKALGIFCLIWGMAGSLISLCLSRKIAQWMLGVRLVDEREKDPRLASLYKTVCSLAQRAGMHRPKVGIYYSSTPNAFATGPSESRSLVAVSSGLLDSMSQEELEGVLGHELAHIQNGDMVTMALLQGVINAFVLFFSRAIAYLLTSSSRNNRDRGPSMGYYTLCYVLDLVLMIPGFLFLAFFSRKREFRADRGSANLLGKKPMIAALQKLSLLHEGARASATDSHKNTQFQYLMIHPSRRKSSTWEWFSTHPAISKRIDSLNQL